MTLLETTTSPTPSQATRSRSGIFDLLARRQHEQLVFWSEPELGYRGIIAIHDTSLGPALGGTRFWNYKGDNDAIIDALRLSQGMTYKAAITGLNLGGGKAVIIGDNRVANREMIFRAHGRAVESLKGRYITAEDVGTSVDDMEYVRMETDHVVGLLGRSGDPSPVTAYGVYAGIKACAQERYGDGSLEGKHVAVQGLGNVGKHLCQYLSEDGAQLTVTDIRPSRVKEVTDEFSAHAVTPEEIYSVDADIFAPCALGGVINDNTLAILNVDIIAGAANNQLAQGRHGELLSERNILYAPDFVINAGGLVNVYGEIHGWDAGRSKRKAGRIYDTLLQIFQLCRDEELPPSEAANRVARSRVLQARRLQKSRV